MAWGKINNAFPKSLSHLQNVALEDFQVTVPSVWYIDSWNPLGGYYVGITKGNDPDDYNCSFTPYNATNQKLVWEAKTPEIAEFMEYFGNGIVPKKAGVAKFHIYSQEDKDISQDISVEFKYKYPLQKAESEKDTYELEEGKFQKRSNYTNTFQCYGAEI